MQTTYLSFVFYIRTASCVGLFARYIKKMYMLLLCLHVRLTQFSLLFLLFFREKNTSKFMFSQGEENSLLLYYIAVKGHKVESFSNTIGQKKSIRSIGTNREQTSVQSLAKETSRLYTKYLANLSEAKFVLVYVHTHVDR